MIGELIFNAYQISVLQNENVLEINYTNVNILITSL